MVFAGAMSAAAAQEKDSEAKAAKPARVIVDVVKLTGTVKAVDLEKKTATVEGSGGRTVTVDAKNARNLDQVKVGDKVTVAYTQELAVFVREAAEAPSATTANVVQLAPKGQKPGGIAARTVELTGNVESVDPKKHTIMVKGPAGNVRTFKVDPAVKNLDQVKKGDQIVLTFTEAVALSVTKP
jgi:ribosomal 50S subunit-recycling heat shock protein